MTPVEVALHILCLVSRRASDASIVKKRLLGCRLVPDNEHDDIVPSGDKMTVPAFLAYVLETPVSWLGNIEIEEAGRYAFVTVQRDAGHGSRLFFSVDSQLDARKTDWAQIGSRFVIGPAAIAALREQIALDQ